MLNDSIIQMPSFGKVRAAMLLNGFKISYTEKYSIQPDLEDKFLYCGKQNPGLYFNNDIRKGISSFSSLANSDEVEKGLTELRKDIDNGSIDEIIRSYENNLGDYLYIIGKRACR